MAVYRRARRWEGLVRTALSQGMAKTRVRRHLEGEVPHAALERILARYPEPGELARWRAWNHLLVALVAFWIAAWILFAGWRFIQTNQLPTAGFELTFLHLVVLAVLSLFMSPGLALWWVLHGSSWGYTLLAFIMSWTFVAATARLLRAAVTGGSLTLAVSMLETLVIATILTLSIALYHVLHVRPRRGARPGAHRRAPGRGHGG